MQRNVPLLCPVTGRSRAAAVHLLPVAPALAPLLVFCIIYIYQYLWLNRWQTESARRRIPRRSLKELPFLLLQCENHLQHTKQHFSTSIHKGILNVSVVFVVMSFVGPILMEGLYLPLLGH